jgi:hypothetical protein
MMGVAVAIVPPLGGGAIEIDTVKPPKAGSALSFPSLGTIVSINPPICLYRVLLVAAP